MSLTRCAVILSEAKDLLFLRSVITLRSPQNTVILSEAKDLRFLRTHPKGSYITAVILSGAKDLRLQSPVIR